MRYQSILDTIGQTPHVRINRLFRPDIEVWLKLERANPGGSIKDRIAKAMIATAEANGTLTPGTTIIEPTSGNTGIGLAMVAAVKGYRIILTMPDSMSVERRRYMKALGAELVLTPKDQGMGGAIAKAQELLNSIQPSWMPQQFENPSNIDIHKTATAREILDDFEDGLDYLISGVGTGGHITGCSELLKAYMPGLQSFAVEPVKSAIISRGEKGPHRIQGIGAGFVPANLHRETLNGVITVEDEDAFEMARRCAREEGIFVGISSGATLAAIKQKQSEMAAGARVLGFCYDSGERYLSIEDLFPAG